VVVVTRRRGVRLLIGATIVAVLAAGVLGTVAVASETNSGAGLNPSVGDLKVFGIRPADLLVPPSGNIVLGDRLDSFWNAHTPGSNRAEVINYLGWLTIALAAAWLVYAWRRWSQIGERRRLATAGSSRRSSPDCCSRTEPAARHPDARHGCSTRSCRRFAFSRAGTSPDHRARSARGARAAGRVARAGRRASRLPALPSVLAMVVSFLELSLHPAKPRFRSTPRPAEFVAVKKTPPGILAE
jgi:hypothetical protein